MTKSDLNCEKSGKVNRRITAICHAHLQALTKTPAKFQKDLGIIVGGVAGKTVGVAFTRFFDGLSDGQQTDRRMGKNNMSPNPDMGRHKYYTVIDFC